MHPFSIKSALKFGWQKTKENFWFLIGLEILILVISIIGGDSILGFLLTTIASFTTVVAVLRISRDEKINFRNLFEKFSWSSLGHYLVAKIIVGIFTVIGLVLLIIPGIIVMIATAFTSFIIVEKHFNPSWKNLAFWSAIKQSFEMTKGIKMKIFLFALAAIGVNILGLIALGIGVLVTMPITIIAFAHLYNERKKHHEPVSAVVA